MHKAKGPVVGLPWKHHAFCFTQESTYTDVYRTIQLFQALNKSKTNDEDCTEFSLSFSSLLQFPDELYKLTWLQKLILTHHRVSFLPEAIERLHNLQYLYLDNNRLSSLPNSLGSLVHLKILNVSNNKLKFLFPLGKLANLESLNVQSNKLVYLPTEISQLTNLKNLNVKDNPLISPPVGVAQKGLAEIVLFLNDLDTGVRPYTKVKIMILGEAGAGKTQLAQWLRTMKKSGKKAGKRVLNAVDTHEAFVWEYEAMVELVPYKPKTKQTIFAQVWDFDTPVTKDLTRALHSFLMTPRTVYLVAWNMLADPKATQLTYWLESIASKFPNCSVVVAATHYDLLEGEEIKEQIREVTATFSEKYSCISRIALVSCLTGSGLERLREMLEEVCASQAFLREKVPASFFGLEDAIAEEKKSRNPPVMLWQEYVSLATICNVTGSLNLYKSIQLFNDSGVVIHLTTKNVTPPVVVLDHNWLLDFITQFTFTKNVSNKTAGLLTGRELQHAVAFPGVIELYWGMLDLMNTVEVVFPLTHRTPDLSDLDELVYFVPRWLPEVTPLIKRIWRSTDPDATHNYDRVYVLNIIPDGLFGKILASMDPLVKIEQWWRNAVIASSEECDSIAYIYLVGSELTIEVRGYKSPVPFFKLLIDILESVLTYRLSPLITRYVTCTECIRKQEHNPSRLLLHTCELAYLDRHKTVECSPGFGVVHHSPLPTLIPETAFSQFVNVFESGSMELLEELGSGAYGVVYKAKIKDSGEIVALKRLENTHKEGAGLVDAAARSAAKLNTFLEFWHEASMLTKIDHDCITGLRGVCFEPLSMALEYIAGPSLYQFANDRTRPITWKLILKIARDLARALDYMHSQSPPIIHRDLKSPNVLLLSTSPDMDAQGAIVKLLDFGTATVLYGDTVWERVVDQPTWQAPEILAQLPYWEACDVYPNLCSSYA